MALDDLFDQAIEGRDRVGENRAPVESVIHSAPSKRRTPWAPPWPLNRWASASWRAASRLIENALSWRNPASVVDERARQTKIVGGASESDASEVIVQPTRASPSPQAMIATPEASARIACRKAALSAWRRRRSLTLAPRQAALARALRPADEPDRSGRDQAGEAGDVEGREVGVEGRTEEAAAPGRDRRADHVRGENPAVDDAGALAAEMGGRQLDRRRHGRDPVEAVEHGEQRQAVDA